jgi:integrase
MSLTPKPSEGLVPASQNPPSFPSQLAEVLIRAGKAAVFAAEEFFFGTIRNEHTRAAYLHAVKLFLVWCEEKKLELVRVTPKDVGQYMDGLRKKELSVATRKQHLAALRHFLDGLVTRHAILLNPALSVRGERYQVVEGKTPEITVQGARDLLESIKTDKLVGLRDRAILAMLAYTAARAGAVAKLRRDSFYYAGEQWMLRFEEKNGKSREIPARHDLEQMLFAYLDAAGFRNAPKDDDTQDRPAYRLCYAHRRYRPHGQMPPARCRPVRSPLATFLPRYDDHGFVRAGHSPRGCPAPGRPRRPAHDAALRPPAEEDHAEHRRADLDLKRQEPLSVSSPYARHARQKTALIGVKTVLGFGCPQAGFESGILKL